MSRTLLVLKHEFYTTIARPSFLFTLVGIPLLGALVFYFVSLANQNQDTSAIVTQIITGPAEVETDGYVDLAGIIQVIPSSIPPGRYVAYPSEAAARSGLEEGEISAYYLIAADYLQSGSLKYIRPDFDLFTAFDSSGEFDWLIQVNLLDGDVQLAALVDGPTDLESMPLGDQPERDAGNLFTFFLPYIVTMIFYIVILGAASLLLNSVTKEKENRVIEILMVSVSPRQMLTGKIVALGLIGLLQTLVWVGMGRFLLSQSGPVFNLPVAFQLPVSFLAWGVVFFMLGYAVYASLMAGLGALVPNLREASQATFVIILPLIIPLFLISILIENPNGTVALVLSLFPLTAPVAMMTRLAAAKLPFWQPLLAALLLVGTSVIVLRAVARLFRAQTLLSGQPFSLMVFFRALLGRG
jgi:ABC-2 type transport system permease protein